MTICERYSQHCFETNDNRGQDIADRIFDEITEIPTADVVKVVRCKDCKYYKQNSYNPNEDMMCMCWCDWLPTDPDDFCSYGELKDGDVE